GGAYRARSVAARPPRRAVVRALDRLDELVLRHRRPSVHVEPARDVEHVHLRLVRVDAARGVRRGLETALLGALVRRPGLVLRLPVVADLLVRVLERRERHAPRTRLRAVLLHRRVVRLGERALRLVVGALQRARDLGLPRVAVARRLRHGSPPAARRRSPPPPSVAPRAGARAPSGVTVRPLARAGASPRCRAYAARMASVLRFRGRIAGWGTASGTRVVVGRWDASPFGAFADVMVERPDGE